MKEVSIFSLSALIIPVRAFILDQSLWTPQILTISNGLVHRLIFTLEVRVLLFRGDPEPEVDRCYAWSLKRLLRRVEFRIFRLDAMLGMLVFASALSLSLSVSAQPQVHYYWPRANVTLLIFMIFEASDNTTSSSPGGITQFIPNVAVAPVGTVVSFQFTGS
jgi:hypothetical protein